MEKRYLYGAAVQGIQGFIFQTNKLREIVGASELVEEICTVEFEGLLGEKYHEYTKTDDTGAVMHAAGNIKYIFNNREDCEKCVREFPRKVANLAPGITISQAVIDYSGNFETDVAKLESLLRGQRNNPTRSSLLGLMGIKRSQQTGLPVVEIEKGKTKNDTDLYNDAGTSAKRHVKVKMENWYKQYNNERTGTPTYGLCEKAFGMQLKFTQIAYDIEKITDKNDWIAIIHVDGNGLGQIVQRVGKDPEKFSKFSKQLDHATTRSANDAFWATVEKHKLPVTKTDYPIPIRPTVLSGDDHTLICRGDLAITYITEYMKAFEKNTHEDLKEILVDSEVFSDGSDHLTSCAGIAFVKSSYPFYYGYELAETLCSIAKKDAKNGLDLSKELPKSCLMFHKVQDSFIQEWDEIQRRELTPHDGTSFVFGPYYLPINESGESPKKDRWTIHRLMKEVEELSAENKEISATKNHLRQWLSLMHDINIDKADQFRERQRQLGDKKFVELTEEYLEDSKKVFPVYDILELHTVINQETKEEENEKK